MQWVWAFLIWVSMAVPVRAACLADGLGQGRLPSWDQRDALARQLETQVDGLSVPADQVRRLALALRMGQYALDQLGPQDLALLAQIDSACDPPPVAQDASMDTDLQGFGFDLHLGWPHLAGSMAATALALGGLAVLGKWSALARRRKKRYFCSIAALCRPDGADPVPCRIRDLSLTGLRMTTAASLRAGQGLAVDFGTFQIAGTVVGRNLHFTSVEFTRDLTRAELLHLVRPEKYPTPFGPMAPRAQQHPP